MADIFIRTLAKNKLLVPLYKPSKVYYKHLLLDIININNKKHYNSKTGNLIYKGKIYKSISNACPALPLHKSLVTEMDKLVENTDKLHRENKVSERFLTILFNFCKSNEDVHKLLGNALHTLCIEYAQLLDEPSKTIQEIEEFKNQYQSYIDILNERYIENLILAGAYDKN